ncbi:hypothetical protein [Ferrimicrobium acidiphilum]|uniref:Uncharacterized protein n=1 Tax=Ferrimicrobium acidiphilum TaxID=121039 RepID=A0ABV3Y1K5_9ACTN
MQQDHGDHREGLRASHRVAIAMRNFPVWSYSAYAITALGLSTPGGLQEFVYGLDDYGARLAIVDEEYLANALSYCFGREMLAVLSRSTWTISE